MSPEPIPTTATRDGASPDLGPGAVWLPWLVRMRWVAVLGQLLAVALARWAFGLAIPLVPLLAIAAFTAASNAALAWSLPRAGERASALAAAAIALDVVLLTTLLGLTGGPANPFSVLYLVHVSLAALLFGFRWSLAIAALCAAAYALLFAAHVPVDWGHGAHAGHAGHGAEAIGLHLQGMWAATAVAALALSYLIARTAHALRERDERLRELERIAGRSEKLVALSALAAGAAHELGSPLATIAVAARELERAAERLPDAPHLAEDARLIREQTRRCREILAQMSGEIGADVGEGFDAIDLASVVAAAEARLAADERARLRVACEAPEARLRAPRAALAQALVNLIRNGLAAAPADSSVCLTASADAALARFEVRDAGAGMAPEVLVRAGEPFFSTRAPGAGMGLGIFLSRAVAEHLGGRLVLESALGAGTRALLEVPRDPFVRGAA
jgi:two-component system sensor histidine kinase RegB